MAEEAIKLGGMKKSKFIDQVKAILPEGGNLNLCLTCGACSSGCPATGLENMDPRKFLRMAIFVTAKPRSVAADPRVGQRLPR